MSYDTPIRRVLIGINLDDTSSRAFYAGLNVAAKYGAQTFVLHVSEPIRAFDYGKKRYVETRETIEKVQEGVSARLDELWTQGGLEAVDRRKVQVLVRGGRSYQELVDTAEAKQVDLIVIGVGTGAVAEQVLRRARCSVFCVRPPVEQDVEQDHE